MAVLYVQHYYQGLDDNGTPLAGGKLYTYEAGTSTPKATYTTAAGTVPNANPIVLDSAGKAIIFLDGSYKFVLKDASDNLVTNGTTDNVTAFNAGETAVDFSALTTASPATDDYLLFSDTSDAGNNKKSTIANVLALSKLGTVAFSAYRGAGDLTATTTPVIFGSENFDTGSGYNASTGVFTAPTAGTYEFTVIATMKAGTGGSSSVQLRKNSTGTGPAAISTVTTNNTFTVTHIISLAVNDTVDVSFSGSGSSPGLSGTGASYNLFAGKLLY